MVLTIVCAQMALRATIARSVHPPFVQQMEPLTCVEMGLVWKLILDVCVTQVRVLVLSLRSGVISVGVSRGYTDYQPRPVSAPPVANMPLPPYPRRRPSDKGSTKQVQAENANVPHKSSDSETDRLQDIQEEPRRRIGPSRVKELAKFFTPTSDEEGTSRVNTRTRRKKLFDPKKEEESEK